MRIATYTDLRIRISATSVGGTNYAVEATINADSFFFGGRLNLDEEKLRAAQLDNRIYGSLLWEALFSEPIKRAYHTARGIADTATGGFLRLRLQIDPDAADLHTHRWERLTVLIDGREVPLSISDQTPFSRFTRLESEIAVPLKRYPLRMVVAVSNPSNLPSKLMPIDVAKELGSLYRSLQDMQKSGKLHITFVPGDTGLSEPLQTQLEKKGVLVKTGATTLKTVQAGLLDCDLFHFIGHGMFLPNQTVGTAVLYLEKPDGRTQVVKDDEIVACLGDGSRVPRLVFLAACESAKRSEDSKEAFVGLGPKLVQAGVPAVIGMQDLVPMRLAQVLNRKFYENLLDHGTIDQAVSSARLHLYENKHVDWSIPVLFMRIRDGKLFAPDPLRTLLEKSVARSERFFADKEPPLPLDIIRVSGDIDYRELLRLDIKTIPGDDFKNVVQEIFINEEAGKQHLAILLGGPGTAKTTQLKYLDGYLAKRALSTANPSVTIPLFAHLARYFELKVGFQDQFRAFLLDAFRELMPDLDEDLFFGWLDSNSGPSFLFIIDGSDRLDDSRRMAVLKQLRRFAENNPRHSYLLACDLAHVSRLQMKVSDYLVIKPMNPKRLKTYLKGLPDSQGRSLYEKLEEANLFDLASFPWILVNILRQVRRGIAPRSRTGVLRILVEEMLANLPNEKGLRSRADRTLRALAWEMQHSRSSLLCVDKAFRIMDAARGNREYQLEEMLSALKAQRILTQVGDDTIRFAYLGIQMWFSSRALHVMPDQTAVLDDITATLGRLSRLRWWEGTLLLLAGMIDDVGVLLQPILYGSRISEGDQVFLAARCIQEAGASKVKRKLRSQVSNALVWLSTASNEPRSGRRQLAVRSLGQLKEETAIPHLVKLVLEQVRTDWQGQKAFEYSSVRIAAMEALRNMVVATSNYVREHNQEFIRLLECWFQQDIDALGKQLTSAPHTHQSIAAFILGDISSRPAAEILLKGFQQPGVESTTRWAITDALLRVEPAMVTRGAILPFIDAEAAEEVSLPKESWKKRQHWYERVAYLIGKLNPIDPRAGAFLKRCLDDYAGVWLKARAIRAIGAIADTSYRNRLHEIALDDFSGIRIGKLTMDDRIYLRSVAIDSLGRIGDRNTLRLLQKEYGEPNPQLHAAIYNASEEIACRLFEHDNAVHTPP